MRHLLKLTAALLAVSTGLSTTLCGCEKLEELDETDVKREGVMPLDSIHLALPENVFKQALVTFEKDTKPAASTGNKTQYISRTYTPAGGQYLVDCTDGVANRIQIIYIHAIPKDAALSLTRALLPREAPPLSRVDDSALKNAQSKEFVENYFYGEDYLIELDYSDNKSNLVKRIMALQLSPEQASALRMQLLTGAANQAAAKTSTEAGK